ncbi:prepilin peptidase [Polynucleobacter brandtiae]|uniref:Leader peptidase (Prepilin peptidase)/N-methyltransferase n=1 Tax=Polynucleobacter brandtiae TaxID=1938816 RepID=A0A2M8VRG0_9BURK|nr:A24 family peptidase [Polynucleobacter brandtiae]PJI80048.1 leader peptidase (prepilin peptidase)/N-methyltransferase [Polynucleobacter brandtiae]
MIDPQYLAVMAKAGFVGTLLYLAYVDWQSFRLPNRITIPFIALGLVFNYTTPFPITTPLASLLGIPVGYGVIWALNAIYKLYRGQNGIGMGDAKLLAGLGAWLGWSMLPSLLLIASITSLIVGFAWLKFKSYSLSQALPFGPFLAIAGIIELLWPQIIPTLLLPKLI